MLKIVLIHYSSFDTIPRRLTGNSQQRMPEQN